MIRIHLANDEQVPATSVFYTECLALILALTLSLSKHFLDCTGIYTDSESAKIDPPPQATPAIVTCTTGKDTATFPTTNQETSSAHPLAQ